MRKLCVIGWRPFGRDPWYLRGDGHIRVYLPLITDRLVEVAEEAIWRAEERGKERIGFNGWVAKVDHARVFEMPLILSKGSFHPRLDLSRFQIYDYTGQVLPTQIFKPLIRLRRP